MAEITVDVDMDDFDLDDLMDGIEGKLKRLKQQDMDKLIEFCKDTLAFFSEAVEMPNLQSLDDKYRLEHLLNAFNKYSIQQLQQLIPV